MENNRAYSIEEIKDMIVRIQVLYTFLSPPSKRKLNKACNKNPMKKLIKIKKLHECIDPLFPNSRCVRFTLPDSRYQTVNIDSFPTMHRNCSFLIKEGLSLN